LREYLACFCARRSIQCTLERKEVNKAMKATEIRKGQVVKMDGQNYLIVGTEHVTPGNWRAMVQTKLKNLNTGTIIEKRLRSTEDVEIAFVENKKMEYLYSSGNEHVFMDNETYDQVTFAKDMVEDVMPFVLPNTHVSVLYCDGKPLTIEPPRTVDLKIVETPPALKGATVTNQYKEAKLETGLTVQVPSFIESGEVIRVDTTTREYVERVK
jgi:elongation factor P